MRTFKFQSAGVALALIAGSAVGVQIIAVTPAAAQAQAFLITPIQTGSFDIKAGEKLTIGRLLSVHATQSNAIITQLFAGSTPGVQINGIPGNGTPSVPFPSLDALLAATVTATANGVVGFVIYARNTLIDGRETQSFGGAVLHFVEPPGAPLQAVAIAALPSPPPITNSEKVPLSKFVTIVPVYSLVQITNITFQATGGAQLNGSSGGAFIPPVLELLAAAPVTASSEERSPSS